ncbi:uncharacterized protein STEHIDRAFT_70940, partial [Stereum hirsutum FP-91666 SS1]|uniref:uncharacterized protein n=1 Tax=Stereum hirsutum (strain FP-91666) TaxID=721885 RepID=UPI000440C389
SPWGLCRNLLQPDHRRHLSVESHTLGSVIFCAVCWTSYLFGNFYNASLFFLSDAVHKRRSLLV